MTTQNVENSRLFRELPQPVGKLVCSFVPFETLVTLPSLSKAFQTRHQEWMQQEWMKLLSSLEKLPFLTPPESVAEVTQNDIERLIEDLEDAAVYRADDRHQITRLFIVGISSNDMPPNERAPFARLIKKVIENIGDEVGCQAGVEAFMLREKLVKRAVSVHQERGISFKALFEQQKALLCRTPSGCGIFRREQDAFLHNRQNRLGPFALGRFEEMERLIPQIDKEADETLKSVWWTSRQGVFDVLKAEGVSFERSPIDGRGVRRYLSSAPKEVLEKPRSFDLHYLHLTHLPVEVAQFTSLTSLNLHTNQLQDLPDALAELKNLKNLNLSGNQFTHVPKVLMQMPGLLECGGRIDLTANPIRVLPEEVYDHFFTLPHWLGKTFGHHFWMGQDQDFFYGWAAGGFCFQRDKLEEIPFALWLRETILLPNWLWLHYNSYVHWWDWDRYKIVSTAVIALLHLVALPFWLINRFLSFAVVPIVTKVRELLGYGRMIRIKGEGA